MNTETDAPSAGKKLKIQSATPTFEYSDKVPCTQDEIQRYRSILRNSCVFNLMAASWSDENLVRSWDIFYKNNKTQAYKDRNWINDEFRELANANLVASRKKFVELGCGVGNSLFPVLSQNPHLECIGVDCSTRAIQMCKVSFFVA